MRIIINLTTSRSSSSLIVAETVQRHVFGGLSRSSAHENQQILSVAEEKTLVRWITRLTTTGFPASPALVVEMAEEIRVGRLHLGKGESIYLRAISEHWIDRFRIRNPDIQGVWIRQIDNNRHNATNMEVVKRWFDAVTELRDLPETSLTRSAYSSPDG
jgi:hypothetical protein